MAPMVSTALKNVPARMVVAAVRVMESAGAILAGWGPAVLKYVLKAFMVITACTPVIAKKTSSAAQSLDVSVDMA